jgi:hypothetical protein
MPPPCDRTMVDDLVAWYADLLCWREESVELSRAETEVDGGRALRVDCASNSPGGVESREATLIPEEVRRRLAGDQRCVSCRRLSSV